MDRPFLLQSRSDTGAAARRFGGFVCGSPGSSVRSFPASVSVLPLMAETKIIYHIDEEETPYLVKLSVSPEKVTLADFKNVLNNRPVSSYKFFFKSMDQDFG